MKLERWRWTKNGVDTADTALKSNWGEMRKYVNDATSEKFKEYKKKGFMSLLAPNYLFATDATVEAFILG